MESCSNAALSERRVRHIGVERNLGATGRQWRDDVERQSPRIEVEHCVGEQPEIERANALLCVRMVIRQIECGLALFRDPELQVPPAESLSPVPGVIELLRESR